MVWVAKQNTRANITDLFTKPMGDPMRGNLVGSLCINVLKIKDCGFPSYRNLVST